MTLRRIVLSFVCAVTANQVTLDCLEHRGLRIITLVLLAEFLYFNVRPIPKPEFDKRLWYLASGCELLRLFVISAAATTAAQVWFLLSWRSGHLAGITLPTVIAGVLWAVLIEAVLFWNGMIRVYPTGHRDPDPGGAGVVDPRGEYLVSGEDHPPHRPGGGI